MRPINKRTKGKVSVLNLTIIPNLSIRITRQYFRFCCDSTMGGLLEPNIAERGSWCSYARKLRQLNWFLPTKKEK